MKMHALLALALACAAYSFSPAQEEKLSGDLAGLQGTWKAWTGADGFLLFQVKGKTFTLTQGPVVGRAEPWTGTLILDEKPLPRHLTWVNVMSGEKNLPDNQCIYELHRDTFLLIGGGPAKRPEQFLSGGAGNQTLVFKRENGKK